MGGEPRIFAWDELREKEKRRGDAQDQRDAPEHGRAEHDADEAEGERDEREKVLAHGGDPLISRRRSRHK